MSNSWALLFGLMAIYTVLQVLVATGRWEGPRPWFSHTSHTADIAAVVGSAVLTVLFLVGLVLSR